jgi:hypothetical protein
MSIGIPNTNQTSSMLAALVGAYNGESLYYEGRIPYWKDLSGHNNNGIIKGIVYRNGQKMPFGWQRQFISGPPSTKIIFPKEILPFPYTTFNISRYCGPNRKRIWTSQNDSIMGTPGYETSANWLSGHWEGKSGIAHHNGWVTSEFINQFGDDWVMSMSLPGMYYGNGTNLTSGCAIGGAHPIGINLWKGEESDWACALMLVFNRVLDNSERAYLTEWAKVEYGIGPELPEDGHAFQ